MELLYLCTAFVIIILLYLKIYLLKKSAREIRIQLHEKLSTDTNTLIDISSADKDMRDLASDLNEQLKLLRAEYIRCKQGDTELKNAVTNISHDLRTPLTAISSYLDLLETNPEKSAQYLQIIRERTDALRQLTEELFCYSVIASPEYDTTTEPVSLNSILEESILSYYASLQENDITPIIDITETKIIRNINKNALSRVFSNLLNNAVKYSDGDLHIKMSNDGVISFSNSAHGLNKVDIERLFDRFYTIETAHKSTGLGLSIAKILVKQMNGHIMAEYKNNKLTIRIMFPK